MTSKPTTLFLVRPIGKFGHTYVLRPGRYAIYALLFSTNFISLLAAGVLEIAFKKLYQEVWGWPVHTPSQCGFVIAAVTAVAAIAVAHRGQPADQETASAPHRADVVPGVITSVPNVNRFLMRAFGIVMTAISVLIITVLLIHGDPVSPTLLGAAAFFAFFTWLLFWIRRK